MIFLLFLLGLCRAQEKVVLEEIRLIGDSRVRKHVVQLKTGISPGDSLNKTDTLAVLNNAARELREMRILDSVSWQLSGPDQGKTLTWYLKKSINFFFVPYVEAADRDINVWLDRFDAATDRLNYGGLIYIFNLAGRNDVLDLSLTTGFNRDYDLFYFMPNVDAKGNWSLLFNTEYLSFKDIAYKTSGNKEVFVDPEEGVDLFVQWTWKTGVQYRMNQHQWMEGNFAFSYRRMDEKLYSLNQNFLNSGRQREQEYQFGLRHIWDTRDNRRFPTSGFRTESLLQYAHYAGQGNDIFEGQLKANSFIDLDNWGLLEFGLRGRMQIFQHAYGYRFSRSLGFNNRIVRGYELYSIPTANYWLLKADYRYLVWNMEPFLNKIVRTMGIDRYFPVQWYINVFADMARAYEDYQNHPENNLIGAQLSGAGAGIDVLLFHRFLFSLQYSWNHLGEGGMFIHFSFNRE